MNHSYSQYLNRLEGERLRRAYVADQTLAAAALPVPQAPWDGQKNSELKGLIQPAKDARQIDKTARAAAHATTTDELRTEGHQIKHRTNPHE